MPGILVSVRSAEEARAAVEGGAAVIDVKEPERGPLGRADETVWAKVRSVVPEEVLVSVALGELSEWIGKEKVKPLVGVAGIAYRKLGLAGAAAGWARDWARLRSAWGEGPRWVGVIYADWERAQAPEPWKVLEVALGIDECAGILVDTWDKSRPSPVDESWRPLARRVQETGRFLALAGGLDEEGIARLASLGPDLFAVRGAACAAGDRRGAVESGRVARLVRAAVGSY